MTERVVLTSAAETIKGTPLEHATIREVPAAPGPHPWQEYNAHGNTCHHPGCDLTEDQHPAGSCS